MLLHSSAGNETTGMHQEKYNLTKRLNQLHCFESIYKVSKGQRAFDHHLLFKMKITSVFCKDNVQIIVVGLFVLKLKLFSLLLVEQGHFCACHLNNTRQEKGRLRGDVPALRNPGDSFTYISLLDNSYKIKAIFGLLCQGRDCLVPWTTF